MQRGYWYGESWGKKKKGGVQRTALYSPRCVEAFVLMFVCPILISIYSIFGACKSQSNRLERGSKAPIPSLIFPNGITPTLTRESKDPGVHIDVILLYVLYR